MWSVCLIGSSYIVSSMPAQKPQFNPQVRQNENKKYNGVFNECVCMRVCVDKKSGKEKTSSTKRAARKRKKNVFVVVCVCLLKKFIKKINFLKCGEFLGGVVSFYKMW